MQWTLVKIQNAQNYFISEHYFLSERKFVLNKIRDTRLQTNNQNQ